MLLSLSYGRFYVASTRNEGGRPGEVEVNFRGNSEECSESRHKLSIHLWRWNAGRVFRNIKVFHQCLSSIRATEVKTRSTKDLSPIVGCCRVLAIIITPLRSIRIDSGIFGPEYFVPEVLP